MTTQESDTIINDGHEAASEPAKDINLDRMTERLEPVTADQSTPTRGWRNPHLVEIAASYTMDQFGQRAGISKYSVSRRIKDGTIRAVRIGRLIRIPASEADRLLG